MRGRKPRPTALKGRGGDAVVSGDALPRCPGHLGPVAWKEWRRLASPLLRLGILTVADRAAFAAYCQAWERWVEAEEQLKKTPLLLKTPSGYVQQSRWLSVANKQLEIMGRFMAELGLTPSSRARLPAPEPGPEDQAFKFTFVTVFEDENGDLQERAIDLGHRDPPRLPVDIKKV